MLTSNTLQRKPETYGVIRGVLISGEAELFSSGGLHEKGRVLIEEKYPGYDELFGVRADGWSKYILVISPIKVQSWGL